MSAARQFLVIEDSEADFRLLERQLRPWDPAAGCHRVDCRADLEAALAAGPWAAVLTDYHLPRLDFLECLELLRREALDVPVILVSGAVGEEEAIELFKRGVWEFVLKDNLRALPAAIERSLREAEMVGVRRRAEQALRDSEEFNRRIIESSEDCIKVLDTEARLLSMSEGGQRRLEIRDFQRYLHQSWIAFWRPEDQPRVWAAVEAARAGARGRFQAFCAAESGRPLWWDVLLTPICDAAGRVHRLLAISRDITAQRHVEEHLQAQAAQLARSNEELRRFAHAAAGRELRMIELKREVNALALRLGEPARYPLDFLTPAAADAAHDRAASSANRQSNQSSSS